MPKYLIISENYGNDSFEVEANNAMEASSEALYALGWYIDFGFDKLGSSVKTKIKRNKGWDNWKNQKRNELGQFASTIVSFLYPKSGENSYNKTIRLVKIKEETSSYIFGLEKTDYNRPKKFLKSKMTELYRHS